MQIYQMRQSAILAVDGLQKDRMMLRQILASRVNFTGVSLGTEALTYLKQNSIDLILLAIKLPDMDAFEFMRYLRSDNTLKEIPVIMMTDNISPKVEAAVTMAGAFDIMRKPFIPIIVAKKVEQVLELQYLHRHLECEVHLQTKLAEDRLASSQRLFEEMVMSLAKTIDAKDAYTRGHSQRVGRYARHIAYKLHWTEEEQKKI